MLMAPLVDPQTGKIMPLGVNIRQSTRYQDRVRICLTVELPYEAGKAVITPEFTAVMN